MSVSVPAQLPEARRRSSRGGPELCTISLDVKVVTPILGGGSQTRALDDVGDLAECEAPQGLEAIGMAKPERGARFGEE